MPIPDRQKQRQDYLRKTVAWRTLAARVFYFTLILVATISFGYISCLYIGGEIPLVVGSQYLLAGLTLVTTLYVGWCCKQISHDVKDAYKEIRILSNLSNTLPVEEILVRASQEPEQEQSTILLRASENTDTPAEELLRAYEKLG